MLLWRRTTAQLMLLWHRVTAQRGNLPKKPAILIFRPRRAFSLGITAAGKSKN
jgi:hypothetical protein